MATGDDDSYIEDGVTTMTTMTMATAQRATGYNDNGGRRR